MQMGENVELQESFLALAQHFQGNPSQNDEDRQSKKVKVRHPAAAVSQDPAKLLQLMASMIIRMDQDAQLLRRQDSFVFFLQMEKEGIIHELIKQGQLWNQQLQNTTAMSTETHKPLRVVLIQKLVATLHQRLDQLSKCTQEDPYYKAAVDTGIITPTGDFTFHRWDRQQQRLSTTDQKPIPLARMQKYLQQMVDVFSQEDVTLKFRALKSQPGMTVTPWLLQLGLRCDEAYVMMSQLSGNKVWTLIGASVKPNTLTQSPQGQLLQSLTGKGKGRGKGKKGGY